MSSKTRGTSIGKVPRDHAVRKLGAGASVVLSLAASGGGCDSQASVIDQICCGLDKCTGAVVRDCRARIEDGLADHRLSRTGVARCADCVANNLKLDDMCTPELRGCRAILDERDCDHACGELDVVLNARTTYRGRHRACGTVLASCRGEPSGHDACGLETLLRKDATRAVDVDIETCAQCLNEVACPNDPSRTATNGCDHHTTHLDLPFCSTLIDRCTSACSKLNQVASQLAHANAALGVCRRGVESCIRSEREEAQVGFTSVRRQTLELSPFLGELSTTKRAGFGGEGAKPKSSLFMQSGGAFGNDQAGGAGGQSADPADVTPVVPELDDCYVALRELELEERERQTEPGVLIEACAACLQTAPLCEDLYRNCAECRALYPATAETSEQAELEP